MNTVHLMVVGVDPNLKPPQVTPAAWAGVYKPLWMAAALLNSGYSYFWDLERDWEIQAFTGPPSGARHHMNSCVNLQTDCRVAAPNLLVWYS